MPASLDLSGNVFVHLTAIRPIRFCGVRKWECLCACGKTVAVTTALLRNGHTKSCGCVNGGARLHPLTLARLKELVVYDADTGEFLWRKKRLGSYVGSIAGHRDTVHGHVSIRLDGKAYQAHVLAWFYHYGSLPDTEIDHINLDGFDNRISNLRLANKSLNGANRNAPSNNTSGYKGVYWSKAAKAWMVRVGAVYVGIFDDPTAAAKAYDAAAKERYGEFARGNSI